MGILVGWFYACEVCCRANFLYEKGNGKVHSGEQKRRDLNMVFSDLEKDVPRERVYNEYIYINILMILYMYMLGLCPVLQVFVETESSLKMLSVH